MIRRAWQYFSGYVIIKVKGPNLERFLNRLARAGVAAWDTERVAPHMLVARVSAAGFRKVRAISRGQGWSVAIVDKAGLPFVCAAALRRKSLLLGALLFAVALFAASNFIWFVRVEGDAAGLEEQIMAVVEREGLRPGVRADRVDREGLQRALLLEIDELAWAGVHVKGALAVVEVAERTAPQSGSGEAGNVVAARDGVVEQVHAFRGVPVVEAGDTVRAGEILISGFLTPGSDEYRRMLEEGRPPYVRADGVVKARMWYRGEGRAYLAGFRERPTGRRVAAYTFRAGEWTLRLGGSAPPFAEYSEARRTWEVVVPGGATISLERAVYSEVEREPLEVDEAEAIASARAAALIDLEAKLPPGAEVVDGPRVEVETASEGGRPVALARAYAEVVGDLGRFEPLPH